MPTTPSEQAALRKSRGAFFTPDEITEHIADWAIRSAEDLVLEPSAGEAAFLVAAVRRLRALGNDVPTVHGVEIHPPSAEVASRLVTEEGGDAVLHVSDFFLFESPATYSAVIGNPPFVRYQDFSGTARDRARFAALQQGVPLSGLASSWAAFVVHSAAQLRPGGRLGLVLPAELLSVNYAAPVRRFLFENFRSVELVVFEEQVFPDAEADTVLVKADGWREPPAPAARLRQTRNASTLTALEVGTDWSPALTTDRWAPIPLSPTAVESAAGILGNGYFESLSSYGETSLGAVTGANRFFALSPARVRELGIPRRDLLRVSPPGSSHLRGLELTASAMNSLGRAGHATWLLYPSTKPSEQTLNYIASGHQTGVDAAYKCRVRSQWWKVPVLKPPDLFLTYMNADTPRLTTNVVGARHLNSVHGVYLRNDRKDLGRSLLPLASINSLTMLSAELAGRSYGGGVLKLEPREADRWWVPSATLIADRRERLDQLREPVQELLGAKRLSAAAALVDRVLFDGVVGPADLAAIRSDLNKLMERRVNRGKSGRTN